MIIAKKVICQYFLNLWSMWCITLAGVIFVGGCGNLVMEPDGLDDSASDTNTVPFGTDGTDGSDLSTAGTDSVPEDTMSDLGDTVTASVDTETYSGDTDSESDAPLLLDEWETVTALTGCGCNDAIEVCGEGGSCIPRCDTEGRCLLGQLPSNVKLHKKWGTYVTLFAEPIYDQFENIIESPKLWKFNLEDGAATLIDNDYQPNTLFQLVGVREDGEFIWRDRNPDSTQVHLDNREGTAYILPAELEGEMLMLSDGWVYSNGTVPMGTFDTGGGIRRAALDGDGTIEMLLTNRQLMTLAESVTSLADYNSIFTANIRTVDGKLWFGGESFACVCDVTDPINTAKCVDIDPTMGVIHGMDGNYLLKFYLRMSSQAQYVSSFDATDDSVTKVYNHEPFYGPGTEYWGVRSFVMNVGWAYCMDNPESEKIIAFPLDMAREPIDIFPKQFSLNDELTITNLEQLSFATKNSLVSINHVSNPQTSVTRTLLIQLPLPPKPCDATLLCSGEGETCGSDGFCVKN
ncbi:MAG: hypothetical protein JXR76_00260 [Deltaproteobacteria bacterium]|nr:hypothetical protein [Deltaproteobacteria bacterium]